MSAAAVHVSHLYFKRRLSKQEIAVRLGISRFKVARLIDQALEEGLVRIEVAEPVALDAELGRRLERAYGLELALVATDAEADAPARAAASWLPELLHEGDVLGVAWGSTIQAVVRRLERAPAVPVVQICGAIAGAGSGAGPAELAWQLAERIGGQFYPLPVPAVVVSDAAREEMLGNGAVAPTVAMFDRVTVALVGIGSLAGRSSLLSTGSVSSEALPALRAAGAVGDLVVHFFDADGRIVDSALSRHAIQLPLERLRAARVIAIAGGPGKEEAIRGALRSGLVDVLVTDARSAEAAL